MFADMIYLDHHSTTPMDPEVVSAMLPWMTSRFGNPHSHTHEPGRQAALACNEATTNIAALVGSEPHSLVVTSGATESNNLAIDGFARHPRQKRRHFITAATEHPAVLDPIMRLQREGFRVTILPVLPQGHPRCGQIDLDELKAKLDDDTAMVSIMWANNEIGTIQPMAEIAHLAHAVGAIVHSDATQAVGRLPIDMSTTDIDMLSASAHKFYGPRGIGFLALRSKRRVRLRPLVEGGGQQNGIRSGTVDVPGLVGMNEALNICTRSLQVDADRQAALRNDLWQRIQAAFPGVCLNGPPVDVGNESQAFRLFNNLNFSLADVEGETMMMAAPELAISSGSACSSVDPRPSHVLTAIGLSESQARRSLRIGIGRFTTDEEIKNAVDMLVNAYRKVTLN